MSPRPSLLITRPLPPRVEEAAAETFDITRPKEDRPLSEAEAAAALGAHDAILCTLADAFTSKAFELAGPQPRTRLLANFGVGTNHLDIAAAAGAGVAVTNTPGAVTEATADIALTLMLMAARRAGEGERLVRAGAWSGWAPMQMLGRHVTGARLGVVGMGRIGRAIARRGHFGFSMEVAFYNRSALPDPGVPACQIPHLHELLSWADFVVIAVPGGAGTRHLIGPGELAAMRPEAMIVNIARGEVIDEAALIAALRERRIAAAGLDVYEFEPAVPDALRALDNVVLLPHLGTSVLAVREEMGFMALENLLAWHAGRPLPNPVAPPA